MKKLLISFLIMITLCQLIACGESTESKEAPSTTSQNQNANNKSDGKVGQLTDDVRADVNKAYTDLQNEYEKQKANFDESKWTAYGDEFKNKINDIENRAGVDYRNSVDYLRGLYSEYDNVLRGTVKEGESKIVEIKNNIENAFK